MRASAPPPLRRLLRSSRFWFLALAPLLVASFTLPQPELRLHVPPPGERPPGRLPWLSSDGARIVDDQGRTVLLRGFNVDTLVPYGDREPYPLDDSDLEMIREAGFDVVRLPIAWSSLEPARGAVDAAYLDRVAATVDRIESHGLYTILDMHFSPTFGPRFEGAGAPEWAYVPFVPGFEWSGSWILKYIVAPDAQAANTYFWTSGDWQADFAMVWQAVARRFRDDPGVAGYDLRNEPHPIPIPPAVFERFFMWPLYGRLIDAVAQVDPNHIFMVENSMLNNLPTAVPRLDAPNVVYAPHVYYGAFGVPLFDGRAAPLAEHIEEAAAEARTLGAPLLVGETGIDHRAPHANEWIDDSLDLYDRLGAGWTWWEWRGRKGWSVRNAHDGEVDVDLLRHLARPYLAAAPAGVEAAPTHPLDPSLTLRVDAVHGPGTIEVAWPAALAGQPLARGSCLLASAPGSNGAQLELTVAPGTGCEVQVGSAPAGPEAERPQPFT